MGRLIFFVIGLSIFVGLSAPKGHRVSSATDHSAAVDSVTATPTVPSSVPVTTVAGEITIARDPAGHFRTDANVNGQNMSFVVDTGADVVALTVDEARRIGVQFEPASFAVIAEGASGPVKGQEVNLDRVELGGHSLSNVRGVVLEGLGQNLLGQNVLSRLGSVQMEGDKMVLR